MRRIELLLACFALFLTVTTAHSEDSVVLGRGISNEHAFNLPCSQDSICMDSMFIWTFAAKRTIVGPEVKGKVRFLAAQHVDAVPRYVRSVELFILRQIDDPELIKSTGAQYYLLSSSPRYSNGTYCIWTDPEEVGLRLKKSDVTIDPTTGYYCFKKKLLLDHSG